MSATVQLTYSIPPPDGSKTYTVVNRDSITGERTQSWKEDVRSVQIEDVRGKENEHTLDTTGFQFFRHPAKHTRFLDDAEIKAEYYPETAELIKKLTGATEVILFEHTVRRKRPGLIDDGPQKRQPVLVIHADQTTPDAFARFHKHLPPKDPAHPRRGRFQTMNLWRPISHPAIDSPLAICDYRTVNVEKDLLLATLIYAAREGDIYYAKYNPEHRWFYKSAMDTADLVLMKSFDSILDGSVARMVLHTGFELPDIPEGTPMRESIEIEALVYYEGDQEIKSPV